MFLAFILHCPSLFRVGLPLALISGPARVSAHTCQNIGFPALESPFNETAAYKHGEDRARRRCSCRHLAADMSAWDVNEVTGVACFRCCQLLLLCNLNTCIFVEDVKTFVPYSHDYFENQWQKHHHPIRALARQCHPLSSHGKLCWTTLGCGAIIKSCAWKKVLGV